jgi:hypothetical protein
MKHSTGTETGTETVSDTRCDWSRVVVGLVQYECRRSCENWLDLLVSLPEWDMSRASDSASDCDTLC